MFSLVWKGQHPCVLHWVSQHLMPCWGKDILSFNTRTEWTDSPPHQRASQSKRETKWKCPQCKSFCATKTEARTFLSVCVCSCTYHFHTHTPLCSPGECSAVWAPSIRPSDLPCQQTQQNKEARGSASGYRSSLLCSRSVGSHRSGAVQSPLLDWSGALSCC